LGQKGQSAGINKSQGSASGPQAGQAAGAGAPGTPEAHTKKRERLRPTAGMSPGGPPVGSFVADGPSPTGESKLKVNADLKQSVQKRSEEVADEPLPAPHRKKIERFYDLILKGGKE